MTHLSVAVMAHPKRSEMVDELLAQLDRPAPVVWDEIDDRHDTGARAMAAFDPECTHHLVLQDDVVPCRDLIAGAEQAVTATPGDCPVSLYTGRVQPFASRVTAARKVARSTGATWITMHGIYWGPAVILPTAQIPEMLHWYRSAEGSAVTNYDRRMSVWWAMRGATVWYSHPSLVDHRGDESLCGHPGSGRRAHTFIGADQSALDVDWSGTVVELPYTERMDDARQTLAARRRSA